MYQITSKNAKILVIIGFAIVKIPKSKMVNPSSSVIDQRVLLKLLHLLVKKNRLGQLLEQYFCLLVQEDRYCLFF